MIFKAMGRETPAQNRTMDPTTVYDLEARPGVACEKCGGKVYEGDWPFCRPGHPEDHIR